jgi:predicted transcriptional regulator
MDIRYMRTILEEQRSLRVPNTESHRGKVYIVYDILISTVDCDLKKTHILYKANISSTQVEVYFSALLAQDLLVKLKDVDGNNVYRTTEKGKRFIHCCEEIRSLIALVLNNKKITTASHLFAFDGQSSR